LQRRDLYRAYLDDDIKKIRSVCIGASHLSAGFMGSPIPKISRLDLIAKTRLPPWVNIHWARTLSARKYVSFVNDHQSCLDLRGFGDKSLRFTEAVLFGRTIIRCPTVSRYMPNLVDGVNAIVLNVLDDLNNCERDAKYWAMLADNATHDYLKSWSLKAQAVTILQKAGLR
jgi:hypothetical protein